MEKYLSAVSEMYSQFKKKEAHPMEKYIGRLANCNGEISEVVGYRDDGYSTLLIVESPKLGGWRCKFLNPQDVVAKECERYRYASINDLIY